jgi:FkbM family methyltransferase
VTDNFKQMLIRTPLERPLKQMRRMAGYWKRRLHPELADYYAEGSRIEDLVAKVLRPTSNCLDVGCHIGSFLSLLLRHAPKGKHIAFEALPEKAERLRRKFPDVEVIQGAVGEQPGEITFFRDLTYSGYSSMNVGTDAHHFEQVKVRCDTLDNLVPADRHIDFMKVDVEGAETLVFRGARKLIARCRPVMLFECAPDGLKGANQSPADVFEAVTGGLGYRLQLIKNFLAGNDEALTVDAFGKSMNYPATARNYVATAPDYKHAPAAA